jgi:hypothetical protein
MWLDRNEWAALRAQNLHDNLHQMVSRQWQADIQRQSVKNTVEDMFRQRLGDAAYHRTADFRAWLATHDKKEPHPRLPLRFGSGLTARSTPILPVDFVKK